MARVAEEAQEEEFGRRVRVEAAGDEEVGDGDAVCNLYVRLTVVGWSGVHGIDRKKTHRRLFAI